MKFSHFRNEDFKNNDTKKQKSIVFHRGTLFPYTTLFRSTGCGKPLFTCAKQICGNCGKLLMFSKYQHFACGKVCGKLVDNFFLLFSIFFFHILEYHNGGLCGQGSDEVECRHHME